MQGSGESDDWTLLRSAAESVFPQQKMERLYR